jgi:hypothetical protein
MTITKTTDAAPPRKHRISLRKRNAGYQKVFRDKRKARFLEVLARLEAMSDDELIAIVGEDYASD